MNKIVPVILSGGMGSRLWPLSRRSRPKQFLNILGDESLIVTTAKRVSDRDLFAPPVLVCNADHRFTVAEQLLEAGIETGDILLEPEARNTGPAIASAAAYIRKEYGDATMVVLPSDHRIGRVDVFLDAVAAATRTSTEGRIVTLGIRPTGPETGYGYIEAGERLSGSDDVCSVRRFTEKPDADTAAGFLASGNFYWNAGMFIMTAEHALSAFDTASPGMRSAAEAAVAEAASDLDFLRLAETPYSVMTAQSFDRLVMEHTNAAAVIPVDMDWSDIGSWDAIWRVSEKDEMGNAAIGDVVVDGAQNCLVHTEDGLVSLVGVRDLAVVVTGDSVLVIDRNQAQRVADVVTNLQSGGRDEVTVARTMYRPWGFYQDIDRGDGFRVKRINVKPGGKLSLQKHNHRAEHWVVVTGTATVTKGEDEIQLDANQSIYIPAGVHHRLENKTGLPLEIIEVQTGSYLEEDDIVRFDDVYGRGDND